MQPRNVASCGDTVVAGLISEQSECYASPPTAVIPVLNHDSRAQECPSVGRACYLNAGDYAALCWPVLERLTAAKLVSDMSTAAAACGS